MQVFNKKLWILIVTIIMVGMLGGCGSVTEKKTATESSVTKVSEAKVAYKKALNLLSEGKTSQAYEVLKPYQNSDRQSVKQLVVDLKNLNEVKRELEANNLKVVKNKLADLLEVTKPKEFVKQVRFTNKEYNLISLANTYYQEIQRYYQAGKYNEAQGSLEALNGLESNYQVVNELQTKAENYKDKIAVALAKQNTSSTTSSTTSSYVNAKNSKLVESQYSNQTGAALTSASSQAVSSVASELTNNDIINQFQTASGISKQDGDQYFIQAQANKEYLIEIRTVSKTNPNVSVLKGMYRFNSQTKVVQKLDSLTGEYKQISVN